MNTRVKIEYFGGIIIIALMTLISGCKDFKYDTYEVTDKPYVDRTSVILYLGADEDMSYIQLVSSPANRQYTWTSQNSQVATVTKSGLVSAVGEGSTNIIVTSQDDRFEVKVQVHQWIPVEKIMLDVASVQKYWYGVVDRFKINALFEPANTTEKDLIEWTTTDPDIATVTNEGWVTYTNIGKVNIIAKAKGVEETVALTVLEQPTYKRTDAEWIDRTKWRFPGHREAKNSTPAYSSQAWGNENGSLGDMYFDPSGSNVHYIGGSVYCMIDGNNNSYWHASWSDPATNFPHWFIVDLSEMSELGGVLLRNRDGDNRASNGFQLYTTDVEVNSLDDLGEASIWTSCGRFTHNPNGGEDYTFAILPPYPRARYVKMYFGPEYRGSSDYTMISEFGLFRPKQDIEPETEDDD